MHDLGKLVFYRLFPTDYNEAVVNANEKKISIGNSEKEIFGFDHTTAGDILAERWNIPETIRFCIRNHHLRINDDKSDLITACVHLANIMAEILELGNHGDHLIDEPNFQIWDILKIEKSEIKNLYDSIIFQYEQAYSILKIE